MFILNTIGSRLDGLHVYYSSSTVDSQLTASFPRSSAGSRHFAFIMTSASYCSFSVSISPIFRNTTLSSTRTWKYKITIPLALEHRFVYSETCLWCINRIRRKKTWVHGKNVHCVMATNVVYSHGVLIQNEKGSETQDDLWDVFS